MATREAHAEAAHAHDAPALTDETAKGWRLFGPGVLTAVAGIGSSHFLLAPTAGALFGYTLAWVIVVAHLVKYPAFAYATRYTVATGRNILHGFLTLPAGRWILGFTLLVVAVEAGILLGAVASVCAATVVALWPGVGFGVAVVGVTGLAGLLLWTGAYHRMERLGVVMLAAVVVLTVAAASVALPDAGALAVGAVVPVVPVGAALVVGGLLGFMPAPLELALLKSLWHEARGLPTTDEARRARLRTAAVDVRTGYVTSAVLAVLLLSLGAALLYPRGLAPTGTAVFTTLAEIYRTTLGDGMVPVYLLGAFIGMFATVYAVLDGFPRGVAGVLRVLGRGPWSTESGRDLGYWVALYATFVIGLLVALVLPDPGRLVNLVATGTVLLAPVWALLITVTTHRLPEAYRPTPRARAVAWAAWAGVTAAAGYLVWVSFA